MANEQQPAAPADTPAPPAQPNIPWLLIGGVLAAAWWWEKKFKKSDRGVGVDGDEDEEDDEDGPDAADVEWTDEPIKKPSRRGRTKGSLSSLGLGDTGEMGGPVTDVFIQPVKLAAKGDCRKAVALLDQQSRQGPHMFIGSKSQRTVRAALRRAAKVVTDECPKEVAALVEERAEWDDDIADEVERVSIQLPSTGRRFAPSREDVMVPGPHGARSFDPREGLPVHRTRGEAGRFKRKTGTTSLEYRRKGPSAWRVLDLHSGEQYEKNVPTGKPRGRPKKLK